MMAQEIDPQNYTQLPRLDVATATALTTSLISAMPPKMPSHVKAVAKVMVAAKDELLASWRNEPTPTVSDRRPADLAVDRAWAACHSRMKSFASLPADIYPEAGRAAELVRQIFPEGLTFLKLPYNQEWAESEKRLQMIDAKKLGAEIDEIAGKRFLAEVRRTHAIYGDVLGITKRSAEAQAPIRAEGLRKLRRAMSRYVFSVLAHADDEQTTDAARAALRPIDEVRAAGAARRASPPSEQQSPPTESDADEIATNPMPAIAPKADVATEAAKSTSESDDAPVMKGAMDSDPAGKAMAPDCN